MIMRKEKIIPKLLCFAVVTTVITSTISFSRFGTQAVGISEDVVVASFVVEASSGNENLLIDCNVDNPCAVYDVVITNRKEDKISGVAAKYNLVLEFDKPIPSGVTISDGNTTIDTNGENSTFVFENVGTSDAGIEYQHTHTITLSGSSDVLYEYKGKMSVYVDATQID